jgi:hypothetical protein
MAPAARATATDHREESGLLTQLFGFVQLEFAGTLAVADGRYLARDGGGEEGQQRVLIVETLDPPPRARATAVRAFEPFESEELAAGWLEEAVAAESGLDALATEGFALLNRALHAQAAAAGDPYVGEVNAERAVLVRVGYGSGEELAAGRFTAAHDVDPRAAGSSRRRRRREQERLLPQARVAAVLGGRERIDACETLLLRARADLDAGRLREAALQLRVGIEALLVELAGALADPAHEQDMALLDARRGEAGEAANLALRGELDAERERSVRELTEICERVLRRRRVLRG